MRVSMWKALGILGLVADQLTKAGADNRITVDEALVIVSNIAPAVGIQCDSTGSEFVMELLKRIVNAIEDKKISINEIINIATWLCETLGVDLDMEGISIK